MGLHDQAIRERIQQGVERSRQVFFPVARDLIESEPARFQGVTPQELVTVIIGLIEGCALQSVINDKQVAIEQILQAVRALLGSSAGPIVSQKEH